MDIDCPCGYYGPAIGGRCPDCGKKRGIEYTDEAGTHGDDPPEREEGDD